MSLTKADALHLFINGKDLLKSYTNLKHLQNCLLLEIFDLSEK